MTDSDKLKTLLAQLTLIQTQRPARIGQAEVRQALRDLVLPEDFHRRIGPAVNSGSSLFLYGPPGNGKTTVAQAIARLLASTNPIWIPYAVTVGGQIIQIFDPLVHILAAPEAGRPIQSVHARDILKTIISISDYADVHPRLSPELIDEACSAYFVVSRP